MAGSNNAMSRRFYFSVEEPGSDPRRVDKQPPECRLTQSTYAQQCRNPELGAEGQEGEGYPRLCGQRRWTARFQVQDAGSGLRAVEGRPEAGYNDRRRFFSHDNFIAGGQTPISVLYAGSCCGDDDEGSVGVTVTVVDVAGNEVACSAGDTSSKSTSSASSSGQASQAATTQTLTIVIAAVAAALALLAAAAGVALFVMRKKRQAQLAEMRETPQAR